MLMFLFHESDFSITRTRKSEWLTWQFVGTRIARPGDFLHAPHGSIIMETLGLRVPKWLCATPFVVGDMVTDVCSLILGDITLKYSCEKKTLICRFRRTSSFRADKIARKEFFIKFILSTKRIYFKFSSIKSNKKGNEKIK